MTQDHDIWQPQEPGKAWKGAGLYHITLKIPSCKPLLGNLVIPNDDPAQARVDYSDLGRAALEYQKINIAYYPEIQILHYCLMPDHLHSIWYVRKAMPRGIEAAVRTGNGNRTAVCKQLARILNTQVIDIVYITYARQALKFIAKIMPFITD